MIKKIILITVGFSFSFLVFSQEKVSVKCCEKPVHEIAIKDFLECKSIMAGDTNYNVNSFTIGFLSGSAYKEAKVFGSIVSDKIIDVIRKVNPTVIYIEHIVLINTQEEQLSLNSFKIKNYY